MTNTKQRIGLGDHVRMKHRKKCYFEILTIAEETVMGVYYECDIKDLELCDKYGEPIKENFLNKSIRSPLRDKLTSDLLENGFKSQCNAN